MKRSTQSHSFLIALILTALIITPERGWSAWSEWLEKGKNLIMGESQPGTAATNAPAATPVPAASRGDLKILSVSPSGTVDDAGMNAAVSVTFDRPMVALEALPTEETPGPLTFDPPLKGKYRWLGTSTLVFTPEVPMEKATRFMATVPAGTTAKDGTQLTADYQWTFESVRPQFLSSRPYHQQQFVDVDASFVLTFNMPMDPKRAGDFIEIRGFPTPANNLFEHRLPPYTQDVYNEPVDFKVESVTEADTKNFYGNTGDLRHFLAVRPRELKKEYTYTLVLREGLPGAVGNLGLLKSSHLQFKTYNHFRVLSVSSVIHPEEPIQVMFSNPVTGKELAGRFSFDPPLELPKELENTYESYRLHIPLKLAPKKKYEIEISNKLKDKFGQKLDKKHDSEFTVTSYVPYMGMPVGIVTVEGYLKPRLPVTAINMLTAKKGILNVTPEKAIPLLKDRYGRWQDGMAEGMQMQDWDVKGTLDKSAVVPLPLEKDLKGGFGFLFARVEPKNPVEQLDPYVLNIFKTRRPVLSAFVQVTNLGITAKCSPESNLVFVSELKTARPVASAGVEIRDDDGKILWEGKTDKNGMAITPGWAMLNVDRPENSHDEYSYYGGNPRVWIIASRGADKSMVASNWGTGIYPWSFNLNYESRQIYPPFAVHLYTDRGLYQAGETVHVKGLYRQRKSDRWILADKKNVVLQIRNSRGEEVFKSTLTISGFGSFSTDFGVAPEAVTGWYSMEVSDPEKPQEQGRGNRRNYLSGSGSFQVEAFRPAKFEATARLDQDTYTAGDKVKGALRGWYLFGAPMKEAAIEWKARLWRTSFQPEGFPGFSFIPRYYLSQYGETHGSSLIASGQEKLDDKGELAVNFPLEEKSLGGPLSLQLEGTVTDEDRQTISGRATAIVHPADYYVGIKLSSTFLEKLKPLKMFIVAVTSDGKHVAGEKVQVKIIRREWHSIRKAGVNGRTSWVSETKDEEVKTLDAKTGNEAVSLEYTPGKSGFYLVRAESKDKKGRPVSSETYFYATGRDYVAWNRSDDDRIELVSDSEKYKPGETAKIMVKSPFETALALVSLEREGIVHQFTAEVKGSADVIQIPLEERFVPNVYVSVVLLQGRTKDNKFSEKGEDIGKPMFKIGYLNVPVDPGTRRLKVTAKASSKSYKPGQKASVEVLITDQTGKPVAAEFSISVADRGILDLINYGTPDSFNTFYGPRALSVETVESRLHVIGQRSYGEKGENRGGGGGAGLLADMELRKKFRGSAFWKAAVVTGANGKAVVEFSLPDNLTTFKAMVTAQTKDARFGAGDTEFTVKKPLMLQPSVPRFARLGDVFEAGVVVHNLTGKPGEVLLAGQSSGLTLTGESQKKVLLENGQSREVRFSFEASKLGNAKFTFGGALGSEKDGFELDIPVIMPRVTEAVALYEDTEFSAQQALKIPDNIYPEAGGLHIEAASTALIGLKEGVEYLQSYPHECLEQKISRVLPFVLADDLLEAFGISDLKGEKRKAAITEILQSFPKFQRGDGGFGYWPSGNYSCEYLTAYAMFFLHEAKKDGFTPDPQMTRRAIEYMQSILRRDDSQSWNYPYRRNGMLTTKAFLVYSLALWGEKDPGYISRLHADLFQIPYFGRALLLKAIPLSGMDKSLGDAVADSLYNSIKIDPTRAHFEEQDPTGLEWVHYSPVQTSAFVLQAMIESGREFPQASKVIRWLMDERKSGRWRSTHENIYVFYGLSEYFRRYEKDEPNFTGLVKLDGKEALKHLFQGRSVTPVEKVLKWNTLPMGKEVEARVEKQGTGRFYYGFRMIYAPKGDLKAREEGISVNREITMENGDPLPAVIKAGSKLLVKLTVTTPFDRSFIAINDWLPAGFQVVNTRFSTSQSGDAEVVDKAQDGPNKWWGSFNHTEYYDERVGIYADYLAHGTHSTAYLVTAVTPGKFLLPPAMVEGMYTPEVFGRSGGGTIEIK